MIGRVFQNPFSGPRLRVHADAGAERRYMRLETLIRRFDEVRRDERLDASAANLLRNAYV